MVFIEWISRLEDRPVILEFSYTGYIEPVKQYITVITSNSDFHCSFKTRLQSKKRIGIFSLVKLISTRHFVPKLLSIYNCLEPRGE